MGDTNKRKTVAIKPGTDLESLFPEVAKRWHPTLNAPILPSEVAAHSNRKYFWMSLIAQQF